MIYSMLYLELLCGFLCSIELYFLFMFDSLSDTEVVGVASLAFFVLISALELDGGKSNRKRIVVLELDGKSTKRWNCRL